MDEGPDEEKEELQEEIRRLSDRVAELEKALSVAVRPIGDLVGQIDRMREVTGNYFRLVELYQRHGAIAPEVVLPDLKDPISIEIVRVLFDQSEMNVTEITERLRERRGSASRTIVRERLQQMVADGIIVKVKATGGVSQYSIADAVVDKWFRLLGLRR
jgi:DNA-binding transcriptional ArsR family regulator